MYNFTAEIKTEAEAKALHTIYLKMFIDSETGSEEESYYHSKVIEAKEILRAIRKESGRA